MCAVKSATPINRPEPDPKKQNPKSEKGKKKHQSRDILYRISITRAKATPSESRSSRTVTVVRFPIGERRRVYSGAESAFERCFPGERLRESSVKERNPGVDIEGKIPVKEKGSGDQLGGDCASWRVGRGVTRITGGFRYGDTEYLLTLDLVLLATSRHLIDSISR